MRKGLGILLVAAGMLLGGCGASSGTSADEIRLENPYYAGYQALDAGKWEEAIGLFQEKLSGDEKEYIALLGLAKAQIGAEKLEEAKETLLETRTLYPDETSAMAYQGEVYVRLEAYNEAADSFYQLVQASEDSVQAREKLIHVLPKVNDYERAYEIYKELYLMDPDAPNYLRGYVWSCACVGDDAHIADLLETVKGRDCEYAVNAVVQAYQKAKAGDMDGARALLFDLKQEDKLLNAGVLFYGDVTDGVAQGLSVGFQRVFGQTGAFIGQAKDGNWDGACEAWYGSSGSSKRKADGMTYEGTYYRNYHFAGNWKQGAPDGEILMTETYHREFEGHPEWSDEQKSETMLTFADGMAQGHAETYEYDREHDGEWSAGGNIIIHEFKDGEAQPFMAQTRDGEKLVYEFVQYEGGGSRYREDNCECSYVWDR